MSWLVQVPMWFGALAASALLLSAGRQDKAVTAAEPPAVLLVRGPGMPGSVRALDATATPDIRLPGISPCDLEVLARVVKGECPPDTPFEGKVAVAAVVLNRARSKRFPMSIPEVAHQEKQFSCCNPSNRARLYDGPIPHAAWEAARAAADGQDPTGGCTHFFNPFLVRPRWARELEFVKRIGTAPRNTHDFYRDKEPLVRRGPRFPGRTSAR